MSLTSFQNCDGGFRRSNPIGGSTTSSISSGGSSNPTAPSTTYPPATGDDFATRCGAPGVIKCVGFDNTTTDIVPGANVWPDGLGVYRASLDTQTKASGNGSLRFDLPPPPHAAKNISGSWSPQDTPLFGQVFSQNTTFYVQYRIRLSPEMVIDSWNGSMWKTSIFHYNNLTCAQIELTTSNYYGHPMAQIDTDCGARSVWTSLDGKTESQTPPMLMQQGDVSNCAYGVDYNGNCMDFVANEWMTIYYKVHVGTWGQGNSSVEAWLSREGSGTYKQFIKAPSFTLNCNADPCTDLVYGAQGYNNITLLPYMTAVGANDGPSTTAHMWFDELIVSTQPIAVPAAVTAPSPSTSPSPVPVTSPVPQPSPSPIASNPPKSPQGALTGYPSAVGWYPIMNTQIRPVCADASFVSVSGNDGCPGVTNAWNSAAYDSLRNRMLIFGGGHNDYFGNEIYAVNLAPSFSAATSVRLTDPGLPTAPGSCSGGKDCTFDRGALTPNNDHGNECMESVANYSQPNSRHTYDGVTYIENLGQMFIYGGSLACSSGNFSSVPWTVDLTTNTWTRVNDAADPANRPSAQPGQTATYNPISGQVVIFDLLGLYSYDPILRKITRFTGGVSFDATVGWHKAAVIDKKRNKFVLIGDGGVYVADLNQGLTASLKTVTTTGDGSIASTNYPGLAYDPNLDRIVAWNGGNTVYMLNLDALTWTTQTVTGAPAANSTGTFKRFNFSPALNGYIAINSVDANGYFLRLY